MATAGNGKFEYVTRGYLYSGGTNLSAAQCSIDSLVVDMKEPFVLPYRAQSEGIVYNPPLDNDLPGKDLLRGIGKSMIHEVMTYNLQKYNKKVLSA